MGDIDPIDMGALANSNDASVGTANDAIHKAVQGMSAPAVLKEMEQVEMKEADSQLREGIVDVQMVQKQAQQEQDSQILAAPAPVATAR
jgi:hypothetical protein